MTEREKTLVEKVSEIRSKLQKGELISEDEQRILDKALEFLMDARMRV